MAISDELLGFVRDALARGVSRRQIEDVLKQAGWNSAQVTAALAVFAAVDFPVPVPRPRPSLPAREAFMYLLLFTGLYIVALNLGRLTFQLINLMLPDAAAPVSDSFEDGTFEVCATFERGSPADQPGEGLWAHDDGRQCFRRTARTIR